MQRLQIIRAAALCAALAVALPCAAQLIEQSLPAAEKKALKDFGKRADEYSKMVQNLPAAKLKPTADINQLEQQRGELRTAIQKARSDAKRGDLFTPEAAEAFHDLIKRLFETADGAAAKTSLNHAEPSAPAEFAVNGQYPNSKGEPVQSVPPDILKELPALPKRLEYCIAGKTLALRDRDANIVVDYLPNAIP